MDSWTRNIWGLHNVFKNILDLVHLTRRILRLVLASYTALLLLRFLFFLLVIANPAQAITALTKNISAGSPYPLRELNGTFFAHDFSTGTGKFCSYTWNYQTLVPPKYGTLQTANLGNVLNLVYTSAPDAASDHLQVNWTYQSDCSINDPTQYANGYSETIDYYFTIFKPVVADQISKDLGTS